MAPAVAGAATATSPAPSTTPTPCATATSTRPSPKLTLTSSAVSIGYQARLTITARLGVADPGAQVSVYAQTVGSTTRTLLSKAPVENAAGTGDLAITVTPSHSTMFTAVFDGDSHYALAVAVTNVYVAARVTQSLSGYYKSEVYGGATYRVYHATVPLKDTVTVAPNKHGQCVKFALEVYFQGAWHDDLPSGQTTTSCGTLSAASTVLGNFSLKNGSGARYRVRAYYVRSATDVSNLNSNSSWAYFRVTA
jgi:hypothetical protein